jgi:hypothetical protein
MQNRSAKCDLKIERANGPLERVLKWNFPFQKLLTQSEQNKNLIYLFILRKQERLKIFLQKFKN